MDTDRIRCTVLVTKGGSGFKKVELTVSPKVETDRIWLDLEKRVPYEVPGYTYIHHKVVSNGHKNH